MGCTYKMRVRVGVRVRGQDRAACGLGNRLEGLNLVPACDHYTADLTLPVTLCLASEQSRGCLSMLLRRSQNGLEGPCIPRR